jgi:hypothetical protein
MKTNQTAAKHVTFFNEDLPGHSKRAVTELRNNCRLLAFLSSEGDCPPADWRELSEAAQSRDIAREHGD